jgi:outer membrane protein
MPVFKRLKFFYLKSKQTIYFCVLLSLPFVSNADNKLSLQLENRMQSPEGLDFNELGQEKLITLEEAQKNLTYKQMSETKNSQTQKLIIDVNKAILDAKENTVGSAIKVLRNLNKDAKKGDAPYTPLSIVEARQKALENNLSLKVIKYDPIIATQKLNVERAKFDNIIFASAKYGRKDLPSASAELVGLSSGNTGLDNQIVKLTNLEQRKETFDAEVGIEVPLRTGGIVKLSAPIVYKDSPSRFGKEEYNSALKFSFSQPLLRDAGVVNNEASINIANLEQLGQQARTRLQSIRIIATIDKAYWALNQAWVELEVRTQQHQYATENLNMVKMRVKEGLTAAVEVNRAEIGVADRLEQLIVATTNLNLAQRQLKFYLNDTDFMLESEQGFIPETNPSLNQFDFQADKLIEKALVNRLELLELELKLTEDSTRIGYLENQTLPVFNLDYSYGALSQTGSQFSNSFNQLDNFSDWYVGFKFEIPVTNEARLSRLNQAVQQRLQRLSNKTLQTMAVRKEILDALDIQNQQWKRILTARQQVLIAGLNYEAELKQFKEGLRTMTEVLEMLTRLGETQMKEIKAITDYQVAQIDLAFATGTLLGYSQVNF